MAFSQFIDLYGRNTSSTIQVTLNGKSETLTLSGKKNIYTTEVPLEKVIQENKVQLSIENIS
ncbi:MAG: hypothetical protein H6767_00660 [Candidatus Peribacteria bacterium]|nr:MAG: hypothetical protein H6767_00660 [Candidatus Peribacteria bacterium]